MRKLSKKISDEKIYKCFIGYLNNDYKDKPLHIMLPKTNTSVKSYDGQTKWCIFKDDDLLEKYNTIGDKVSADIKKNLIASLSIIRIFWKLK